MALTISTSALITFSLSILRLILYFFCGAFSGTLMQRYVFPSGYFSPFLSPVIFHPSGRIIWGALCLVGFAILILMISPALAKGFIAVM